MTELKTAVRLNLFVILLITADSLTAQEDWLAKDANWNEHKSRLQVFGERFENAWELYAYLQETAKGGDTLTWEDMAKPAYDWSGVYTRTGGGLSFDPDIRANETTAKLTPAGASARQRKIDLIASTGGEYDPISDCRPPSFPRIRRHPEPDLAHE